MTQWPEVVIAECAQIVSGATPSTTVPEFWHGDIAWATPTDLSNLEGHYLSDTARRISARGLQSCAASVLPVNSVLFSSRAPIGMVAVNKVPVATNQGFKSFIPKQDRLDAKFLFHWLRLHRSQLQAMGNGATFKELSKAAIERIKVQLPPIAEQRRLAAILDQADSLRSQRLYGNGRLNLLQQSLFEDMFGDPLTNLQGYQVRPLAEIVEQSRPITYGILKPGPDTADGVPYVRVLDMKDGGIDPSGLRRTTADISSAYRRSLLKPKDVLLSIRGHVGRLAIVPNGLGGANITQDTARLASRRSILSLVVEQMRTLAMQRWMARRTKGMAVQGINLGDVKKMPIMVPPLSSQETFATAVRRIDDLAEKMRASRERADALFASLQHRAFRGEL